MRSFLRIIARQGQVAPDIAADDSFSQHRGLAIAAIGLGVIYFLSIILRDIDLLSSWGGWSPVLYINQLMHPENYTKDFPVVGIYKNTFSMYFYPYMYSLTHASPQLLLKIYITLDALFFSSSLAFLALSLRPRLSLFAVVLIVFWSFASLARAAEMSSFGSPYFRGLYYHTTEAFLFIAVGAALRRDYVVSWLFLAMGFASHPAYSLAAFFFMGGLFIARGKQVLTWRHGIACGIAGLFMAYWAVVVIGVFKHTPGDLVSSDIWYRLTKLCQYDFFPGHRHLYDIYHYKYLVPMLGVITFGLGAMRRRRSLETEVTRNVLAGLLGVSVITAIGLLLSDTEISTFVTRLNLHRSNVFLITIVLIFCADWLTQFLFHGRWWEKLLATGLIVAPFLYAFPAFPAYYFLVLALPDVWKACLKRPKSILDGVFIGFFALAAATPALYYVFDIAHYPQFMRSFFKPGLIPLAVPFFVFALLFSFSIVKRTRLNAVFQVLLLGMLFVGIGNYLNSTRLTDTMRTTMQAYLEAQIWAKENTPSTSLFMVDPGHNYGWSDYSMRSSFGCARLWIMSSWLYSMDKSIYDNGIARLKAMGIDYNDYLTPEAYYPQCDQLCDDAGKNYYAMSPQQLSELARNFGIDYFVMQKSKMPGAFPLKPVYENQEFAIFKSDRASQ